MSDPNIIKLEDGREGYLYPPSPSIAHSAPLLSGHWAYFPEERLWKRVEEPVQPKPNYQSIKFGYPYHLHSLPVSIDPAQASMTPLQRLFFTNQHPVQLAQSWTGWSNPGLKTKMINMNAIPTQPTGMNKWVNGLNEKVRVGLYRCTRYDIDGYWNTDSKRFGALYFPISTLTKLNHEERSQLRFSMISMRDGNRHRDPMDAADFIRYINETFEFYAFPPETIKRLPLMKLATHYLINMRDYRRIKAAACMEWRAKIKDRIFSKFEDQDDVPVDVEFIREMYKAARGSGTQVNLLLEVFPEVGKYLRENGLLNIPIENTEDGDL